MLLTVAMFWIFFDMKSVRQCLALAFCAIVLFHCVPFAIAPYFALGLTAFLYRPWAEQRRWFLISIPIVAVFTLPWLALARTGYSHDVDPLPSIAVFFGRCLQYVVECASVTPVIGIAILFLFCLARAKRGRDARHEYMSILRGDEFAFVVAMLLTLLCYAGAIAFTKSGYGLWLVGIRYTAGIVPLVAVAAGLFIAKAAGDRAVLWLSLLLIFVFTKFAQVTPWTFAQSKFLNLGGNEIVEAHVPVTIAARYLQPEQALFVRDLFRKNRGAVGEIVDLLREQAKLEDVLIANYEYEPIYFHTGLRLGLTIARDSPVYDAARRQHLSEYCFGADHVRWIAWRPAWDLGPEDSWAQLQRDIAANGGRIEQVTQIKETFWENRENIHFHRFAGDQYLFAWFPRTFAEGAPESFPPPEQLPAGAIFRVDWPTD
jgi:hypothetical protein